MDRQCVFRMQSKMLHFAKECLADVDLMRRQVDRQTVCINYGTQGRNMAAGNRGVHSPSLALKYFVRNVSKGRLLKQKPEKLHGKYLYAFDETDRMIYAKQFPEENEEPWGVSEEYIFYQDDDQLSAVFSGNPLELHGLTLCESWNALPQTYAQLNVILGRDHYLLELEQYEYEQERLSRIKWYNLFMNDKKEYEGGGQIARIRCNEHGETEAYDMRPELVTPFAVPEEELTE